MIGAAKLGVAASLAALVVGWSLSWRRPAPLPARVRVIGWVVDSTDEIVDDSFESIDAANGAIAGIDLFRWRLSADGHVVETGPIGLPHRRLLGKAAQLGAWRGVTLANDVGEGTKMTKDAVIVHDLIATPARRRELVEEIAARLRESGDEVFDLDFEQVFAADREAFSQLVAELAQRLHADGRRLAVTVQPRLRAETRNGPGAEDLSVLASTADEIRLMAYHLHYSTSDPGPAAPLPWVRALIEYAVQSVPREKLVVALYAGGWKWSGGDGLQVSFRDALELARTLGAKPRWSASDAAPFFHADGPHGPVEVWYESACSLKLKAELATEYHLAGIALWRLGQEDAAVYEALRAPQAGCPGKL